MKKGFHRQRRNKSNDTILCLMSKNAHTSIQNARDLMYSCRTDNAVVFKWHVRCRMDALEYYTMRNGHAYNKSTIDMANILILKHGHA